MSKHLKILGRLQIILLLSTALWANPIPQHILNELYLSEADSSAWILELACYPGWIDNFDGWFLVSSDGTATFKPGISTSNFEHILITKDSLDIPLSFSPDAGVIALFNSSSERLETLRWGAVTDSYIAAPLPGQSMGYRYEWPPGELWVLDNTPTLGSWNDNENVTGTLAGRICDMNGASVSQALVFCGSEFLTPALSNSEGRYTLDYFASMARIKIQVDGVDYFDSTLQFYPDSLITLDCQLENYAGIHAVDGGVIPRSFAILQNYPNPFNASTVIGFDLPEASSVKVRMLRLDGSLVTTLVQQSLAPGSYEVKWDARHIASGTYLCQMQAGTFSATKKMTIIK